MVHFPEYVRYWSSETIEPHHREQRSKYPEFEKLLLSGYIPKQQQQSPSGPRTYSNSVGRMDTPTPSPKHNSLQMLFLNTDFQRWSVVSVLDACFSSKENKNHAFPWDSVSVGSSVELERPEFECRNGSDVRLSGSFVFPMKSHENDHHHHHHHHRNGRHMFEFYFQIKPSIGGKSQQQQNWFFFSKTFLFFLVSEEFPAYHRQMKQERDIVVSQKRNNPSTETPLLQRFILFASNLTLQCTSPLQLQQYFASEDFIVLLQSDVVALQHKTKKIPNRLTMTAMTAMQHPNATSTLKFEQPTASNNNDSSSHVSFDQWWQWSSVYKATTQDEGKYRPVTTQKHPTEDTTSAFHPTPTLLSFCPFVPTTHDHPRMESEVLVSKPNQCHATGPSVSIFRYRKKQKI